MTYDCTYCNKRMANKSSLNRHVKTNKTCLSLRHASTKQLVCKTCSKNFATKSSLNYHMKTNKTCLSLRRKNTEQFSCVGCSKCFNNKSSYNRHISACSFNKLINKITKDCEEKLLEQEAKHKQELKELQDRIQELAKLAVNRPTTMNHTTNNVLLTPFNIDDVCIKDKINEFYNLEYFQKGHQGVAEFTKQNLLVDDKGFLKYKCCDPSRMIFKYRDETGHIRKDVKANRLTKRITPDIIIKAHSIVVGEVKKLEEDEKDRSIEFYNMFFKLKELEDNPEKLGNELIKLVS